MKFVLQEGILRGIITTIMYYVYVLQSETNKQFYIGFTENLKKRLQKHNQGENISTKKQRPWKLIYCEGYLDKHDALGREKFLKSGSGRKYLHKQLRHYFVKTPI